MRWLPVTLALGLILVALSVTARRAGSSSHGIELWNVRLDAGSSDHWVLLDTGRVRGDGGVTFVFLLAHPEENAPPYHYDEMKVVGGAGGRSLWDYDGSGSDYVDGRGSAPENASEDAVEYCSAPRLQDVDGDGSDDVVFVEHDFSFGRLLRAARIEP